MAIAPFLPMGCRLNAQQWLLRRSAKCLALSTLANLIVHRQPIRHIFGFEVDVVKMDFTFPADCYVI